MEKESLFDYSYNKYSQAGQDGMLEYIFNKIGVKKGFFIEFGARDGIRGSNCRKLFEEGWSGIFIENDKKYCKDLQKNYQNSSVIALCKTVESKGPNKLDNLIKEYVEEKSVDLISIDIDGPDLEIFESIEKYLPKVVLVEGGKGPHPFDPRMPKWVISNTGQSLKVINQVAEEKGYKIICSFQDVILVKKEYANFFNTGSSLIDLYTAGYKAQSLTHIPLYYNRLKRMGRRNRILEYILKKTGYFKYGNSWREILRDAFSNYEPAMKWEKENRKEIIEILDNLPDHLLKSQAKLPEKIFSSIIGLFLFYAHVLKKFLK